MLLLLFLNIISVTCDRPVFENIIQLPTVGSSGNLPSSCGTENVLKAMTQVNARARMVYLLSSSSLHWLERLRSFITSSGKGRQEKKDITIKERHKTRIATERAKWRSDFLVAHVGGVTLEFVD